MLPGELTLSGLLGNDTRTVEEIITADEKAISQSGKTPEELADRLEYFTQASKQNFMGKLLIDGIYEVETEVYRGKLSCPFNHAGLFRKTLTHLKNKRTGICIRWTTLNIHLLREHHFCEGKGSAFRLEPDLLIKTLY